MANAIPPSSKFPAKAPQFSPIKKIGGKYYLDYSRNVASRQKKVAGVALHVIKTTPADLKKYTVLKIDDEIFYVRKTTLHDKYGISEKKDKLTQEDLKTIRSQQKIDFLGKKSLLKKKIKKSEN